MRLHGCLPKTYLKQLVSLFSDDSPWVDGKSLAAWDNSVTAKLKTQVRLQPKRLANNVACLRGCQENIVLQKPKHFRAQWQLLRHVQHTRLECYKRLIAIFPSFAMSSTAIQANTKRDTSSSAVVDMIVCPAVRRPLINPEVATYTWLSGYVWLGRHAELFLLWKGICCSCSSPGKHKVALISSSQTHLERIWSFKRAHCGARAQGSHLCLQLFRVFADSIHYGQRE